MLLLPSSAGAHALLVDSDPGSGVSLDASPTQVVLDFTEEPDEGLSGITVLDDSGTERHRGRAEVVPGRPRSLRVALPELADGVYTVSWRVLSRVDGHFTAGAFAFGIGVDPARIEPADVQAAAAPGVGPLEPAARFVWYLGLVVLVGAAWFGAVAGPAARPARLSLWGALGSGVGVVALGLAQYRAAGAALGAFVSSQVGRGIAGRALFVLLAGCAAAVALRVRPRAALWVSASFGVAAMAVHVAVGHAATGSLAWVKIVTQLVHFAAAAVWIGGLGALVLALRMSQGPGRQRMIRTFSAVAGAALAVVVATGTARAVAEVGSWSGLIGSGYGRLVIVKVVLLGVLAALGARNRWANMTRGEAGVGPLRTLARGELAVAMAVFAATAVLATLVPARSASLAAPESIVTEGTDFARTTRVVLELTPGYPGANEFRVEVERLSGGSEVSQVSLRLSSAAAGIREVALPLRRSGGAWLGRGAVVAVPGVWRAVVLVDRGADSVEIPLTFHTRCRAQAPPGPAPRILDIELPVGSVQVYTDPGEPGRNEVHFTFFDAEGAELAMADDPAIEAFAEKEANLDVRRFTDGHFIGGGELEEGRWTFTYDGKTRKGDEVTVCFTDEIR